MPIDPSECRQHALEGWDSNPRYGYPHNGLQVQPGLSFRLPRLLPSLSFLALTVPSNNVAEVHRTAVVPVVEPT